MAVKTTSNFKDFVISELSARSLRGKSGEFLVCQQVRESDGRLSLNLDLPHGVKQQMLDAVANGNKIRIFSPGAN